MEGIGKRNYLPPNETKNLKKINGCGEGLKIRWFLPCDDVQHRHKLKGSSGSTVFAYDSDGNIVTKTIRSQCFITRYAYDE